MNLRLNPGVAWAYDHVSEQMVKAWYHDLDEEARTFFRVATTWEEVRDHVTAFNKVGFAERMLGSGLMPNHAGQIVNVILVGYAMGSEGVQEWGTAQERLARIARNVQAIDSRAILLARPAEHRLEDRFLQAPGLELPAWILSSRASTKEELSEGDFQQLLCQALDCLMLAERTPSAREEAAGAFFDTSVRPDAGRLLGTPVRSIDYLMKEYVAALLASLAVRALDGLADASLDATILQNRLWDRQRAFLGGGIGGPEYVDRVLRRDLPESVPFHLLTGDLRLLFQTLADGLEIEVRSLEAARAAKPNPVAPLFFQRIADFFRRFSGSATASERPTPTALRHADAEHALVALRRAVEFLSQVRAVVESWRKGETTMSRGLSQELLRTWARDLGSETQPSLNGSRNADLVAKRIIDRCRDHAAGHFAEWLAETGRENNSCGDILRSMQNGHFLRFSAATRSTPRCASAVTNIAFLGEFMHGGDHVTVTRLRFWPRRPPLLLAVSDPVPFSDYQG